MALRIASSFAGLVAIALTGAACVGETGGRAFEFEASAAGPEGTGGPQSSGEGPLRGAAGAAQQEGEGVGEGEGAEEVVPDVAELREIVDLIVKPSGERGFGLGAQ